MTTSYPTVLTQGQRYVLAHDYSFGGGSILQAAIAANPRPDLPFIRPVRPIAGTDCKRAARAEPARPRPPRAELVGLVPRAVDQAA